MDIAVLGTGEVGRRIATALIGAGHAVCLGSRSADHAGGQAWAAEHGGRVATFADAAAGAELVFLCTSGQHAVAVVESAGSGLDGKVLVDLTNPLDFSQGFPPRLFVCNDDSLGERVQRAAPRARVVKALNTVSNTLMLSPGRLPGAHDVLLCGDDADAKSAVADLLTSFGWPAPIDIGPISGARGLEAWLLLWTRLYAALGTPDFNLSIVRG